MRSVCRVVVVLLLSGCGGSSQSDPSAGGHGGSAGGVAAGSGGADNVAGSAGSGGSGGSSGAAGAGGTTPSVGPTAPLAERFAVGPDYVCAVSSQGTLACWGPGAGDLVATLGAENNRAVSISPQYACVLKRDGTPVCSGYLGRFGTAPLIQLDVGSGSFCGVEADGGRVVCRGDETSNVPADLMAQQISVAGVYACAVASDDSLSCWGIDQNDLGQLDPPEGGFSQVSAYLENTCAVDLLGQIACWGYGFVDPTPVGEFESVALGIARACALGTDGLATCWGFAEPADIVDVPLIGLGIGDTLVCGVLTDGQIRCFGEDAIELPADATVD